MIFLLIIFAFLFVSVNHLSHRHQHAYLYMALVDLCIVIEINWGHIFNVLIFSILKSTFNWNLDRNWLFALKIRVVSIWLSFSIQQNRSTLTISVHAANSELNRMEKEKYVCHRSHAANRAIFIFAQRIHSNQLHSLSLWLDRCLSLNSNPLCTLFIIPANRYIRGQIYFSVHFDEFSEKEMFGKENGKFNGKSIDSILKRVPRKYMYSLWIVPISLEKRYLSNQ